MASLCIIVQAHHERARPSVVASHCRYGGPPDHSSEALKQATELCILRSIAEGISQLELY